MSDVGISKLCKRANVPCPPVGYWRRLELGLKVEQTPLPPQAQTAAPIIIEPAPSHSPFDEAFWQERKRLRATFARVSVPSLIEKPHKALAGQVQTLATDSFTATALKQRRLRILDTLFRQAEQMGFVPKATETQTWLEYGLHRVELQAQQHVRQVRHAWPDRPGRFSIELKPTGLLSLRMRCPVRLPWKLLFIDEPSSLIEGSIADIVTALALTKAHLDKRRVEEEREAALFEAECDLVVQREEARRREDESWEKFMELAERTEKAKSVRSFIEKLEVATSTDAEAAMLAWAKQRLAEFDPLMSVGGRGNGLRSLTDSAGQHSVNF